MARKKKHPLNELNHGARGIVVGGSILGIGASLTAGVGGPTGGLTAAASFLPATGTILGGSIAIGQLKKLQKPKKRKR